LKEELKTWNEVAAIGDDLNDYKMLKKAAISFTPANGSKYIKEIVNIQCKSYGGKGAVREMIEYIIKEDGIEEDFIKAWL
jgi:3-deoxy-D-manno-octulosonate 8-phosphate phosphatase (KDO 8-P phosphatase)